MGVDNGVGAYVCGGHVPSVTPVPPARKIDQPEAGTEPRAPSYDPGVTEPPAWTERPARTEPSGDVAWHRRLAHVAAADVTPATAQTPGLRRFAAISGTSVGAEHLWMGLTHVEPAMNSGDHHHGASETAIYVVAGHPVFVFAEAGVEVRVETKPGDFVFVPPYAPHREENPSPDEEAVVVIARSTQEAIVVNLPNLVPPPTG